MSGYDPTKIPLATAPAGQNNSLVEASSRAWIPRLAIYTTLPVAFGFIFLRIYARLRFRIAFGWDDYLCIAAAFASAGFCAAMLADVINDMYGRHSWNIPLSAITVPLMQETCATTAAYLVAAPLIKISLCLFFRRIFSPSHRSKIMIWIGILITTISYTAFFIAWILCSVPLPGDGGWNDIGFFTKVGEKTPKLSVGLGVLGTFTDFYIIAIPLTAISGLNMSVTKKVGVSALFATGLLACSFSVAGLASRLSNYRATVVHHSPDPFWTTASAYGLAVAEINIGIICACIPVTYPLFRGLAEKSTSTWYSWRQYRLKSRSPKNSLPTTEGVYDVSVHQLKLPKAPKGNLRTLLSFVRGSQSVVQEEQSKGSIMVTQHTDVEMAHFTELQSVGTNNMYHTHLHEQVSQRNLVGHYADAQRG